MSENGVREIRAEWQGEMAFIARNAEGGKAQMGTLDGTAGLSPMEFLLAGLAGCTGVDIVSILKKKRRSLKRFEVVVRGWRRDTHPKVYTRIEVTYRLWGDDLPATDVEQAIQLSKEKYCSASAMLGATAMIDYTYSINPST